MGSLFCLAPLLLWGPLFAAIPAAPTQDPLVATVWFFGDSGWAVRMENSLFVFD